MRWSRKCPWLSGELRMYQWFWYVLFFKRKLRLQTLLSATFTLVTQVLSRNVQVHMPNRLLPNRIEWTWRFWLWRYKRVWFECLRWYEFMPAGWSMPHFRWSVLKSLNLFLQDLVIAYWMSQAMIRQKLCSKIFNFKNFFRSLFHREAERCLLDLWRWIENSYWWNWESHVSWFLLRWKQILSGTNSLWWSHNFWCSRSKWWGLFNLSLAATLPIQNVKFLNSDYNGDSSGNQIKWRDTNHFISRLGKPTLF